MVDWSIIGRAERPRIRTLRLVLDTPRDSDADTLVSLAGDIEVARWLCRLPHPYARAEAEAFLREVVPNELCWAIRPGGGALAGVGGLAPRGEDRAELGYWIGRPHQGRGYGGEAVRGIVDFGFRELGLGSIVAIAFEANVRSLAILAGLGFREVGRGAHASTATCESMRSVELELRAGEETDPTGAGPARAPHGRPMTA